MDLVLIFDRVVKDVKFRFKRFQVQSLLRPLVVRIATANYLGFFVGVSQGRHDPH